MIMTRRMFFEFLVLLAIMVASFYWAVGWMR